MLIDIHFSVISETKFGQSVFIAGNIPGLGCWRIQHALKLNTNQDLYPQWKNIIPLQIQFGTCLQFKMFIKNSEGNLVYWQNYKGNRTVMLTASIIISFESGKQTISLQKIEKQQSQHTAIRPLDNISYKRRGTVDVINDLSDYSQSSSGNERQFWNEKIPKSIKHINTVQQFLNHATMTASSSLRNLKSKGKNKSKQFNINVKNLVLRKCDKSTERKNSKSHIAPKKNDYSSNKMNVIDQYLGMHLLQFDQKADIEQEIAAIKMKNFTGLMIFHMAIQDLSEEIVSCIIHQNYYFSVLYIRRTLQEKQKLVKDFHVLVVENLDILQNLLLFFESQEYNISLIGDKKFCVRYKNACSVIIYEKNPLDLELLYRGKNNTALSKITQIVINEDFFEKAAQWRVQKKFNTRYLRESLQKLKIVLNCDQIQNLPQVIINDLIDVSSRNEIQVFLLTQDELEIIRKKIPISEKSRLVVLNSHGKIFAHRRKPTALSEILQGFLKDYNKFIAYLKESLLIWKQVDVIQEILIEQKTMSIKVGHKNLITESISSFVEKEVNHYNHSNKYEIYFQKQVLDNSFLLKIQPLVFKTQFYIKTIISMAQSQEYLPEIFFFDQTNKTKLPTNLSKKVAIQSFRIGTLENWNSISFECFSNILRKLISRQSSDISEIQSLQGKEQIIRSNITY